MKAGWALLRRRDFGLLWAGGLVSETGDWFLLVGLPIWVLQITGSSLVTATVFLVGLLPGLVVGPLAGVLVDRWDRRRTLVAVSLAQAAFLLPLLAVDGRGDLTPGPGGSGLQAQVLAGQAGVLLDLYAGQRRPGRPGGRHHLGVGVVDRRVQLQAGVDRPPGPLAAVAGLLPDDQAGPGQLAQVVAAVGRGLPQGLGALAGRA